MDGNSLIDKVKMFSKIYLSKSKGTERGYTAWLLYEHPPIEAALDELLVNDGYSKSEDRDYYRNSTSKIQLVTLDNVLNYYKTLFGNRYMVEDGKVNSISSVSYVEFSNQKDLDNYRVLCGRMVVVSEAEGVTHRYMSDVDKNPKEYFKKERQIFNRAGIMSGLVLGMGVGLLFRHPFYSMAIATPLGYAGGRLLAWNEKRKIGNIFEKRKKLKEDYDKLFNEFEQTYASRIICGKEALEKALL